MKRIALAVGLLVSLGVNLWTQPAEALTAEELESACRAVDVIAGPGFDAGSTPPEEFMTAFGGAARCAGFVDGFLSAAVVAQVFNSKAMTFCQPKGGISIDQARRIFLKFTASHPEDLHWDARTILAIALRSAFPCAP